MEINEKQIAEFKKLLDKFKRVPPKPVYEPTYLELCEYPWNRREEICSRLFAFFFDSRNPHGLGSLFFDALLEVYQEKYPECKISDIVRYRSPKEIRVETEIWTENNKRIDLLVSSDQIIICIENKIDAQVNEGSMNEYVEYVNKQRKKCVSLFILLALCEKDDYKQERSEFKLVLYRDFLSRLKHNLGVYITQCNSKYLPVLTDFIQFLDRKGGYMSDLSIEERNFFIDNDKELCILLERRERFLSEQRKMLEQRIERIQAAMNRMEHDSLSDNWWNGDLYLGGHLKKGDDRCELGIEAGFAGLIENRFNISISIWKWGNQKGRIDLYQSKLENAFEILKEDKTSGKWYVVVKELDACDDEKIVNELCEVYKKVEEIVNQVANWT